MTTSFYKDLMDPTNENSSDISEIGPADLEDIVKGVDDIDDALFGFKPKQQDSQKNITPKIETKPADHSKVALKKQSNVSDFPEGDPLANISLSDDDFYGLEKNSPSSSINQDKSNLGPKLPTQDRITKSKKIADLFGLDDEGDVVIENKKQQENAADWLGIKDSPVKSLSTGASFVEENLGIGNAKTLTDSSADQGKLKNSLLDVKATPSRSANLKQVNVGSETAKSSQSEIKLTDKTLTKPAKSGDSIFNLLGDKNEQSKGVLNIKDKKSAVFEELFGDSAISQKNKSRRNSAAKTPEVEPAGASNVAPIGAAEDKSSTLAQYVPSVATSKRPGLGRRSETTHALPTTQPPVSLFQDDWLIPSDQQQESKKETNISTKSDTKTSGVEVHEGLPTWLGGSVVRPTTKTGLKQTTGKTQLEKPSATIGKTIETEESSVKDSGAQMVDSAKIALATSAEQSHQTALALQRTEAQLLAAIELQAMQSGLSAVCARQRSLLDSQEKQLTHMVAQQTDRQTQLEKQLTIQQQRIQQLMDVLAENIAPSNVNVFLPTELTEIPVTKTDHRSAEEKKEFEREIQKATFENEELRLRISIMEKHYQMEYDSIQVQHRREIESWEEKLTMQKELTDKLREDYNERLTRLKESHAELLAQHNERVCQLREEKAEDMRQLMDFHKATLEQMMSISKLVPPAIREEQKTSFQTWKPLDGSQLSAREEELLKKENILQALQDKLEVQKSTFEKKEEEIESRIEQEKIKLEEISRQLKHEKDQVKYQQQRMNHEKKQMEEQYYEQRKQLEEMQERILSQQTQLTTEKLKLAEEKAQLDALAKLQGVSGTATFDVLKSKAEVHGALEAARSVEMQAVEERKKLKEKERRLDLESWRLKEMEEDLIARAEHVDRLIQVSEANRQSGQKALDEAKEMEKRAEEKLKEVEKRKIELREKEKNLIKMKLDIAQEEMRLNRKREQLELVLPPLSSDEAMTLEPIKDVIDPKMLIMKLRAEREFEAISKPQQPGKELTRF